MAAGFGTKGVQSWTISRWRSDDLARVLSRVPWVQLRNRASVGCDQLKPVHSVVGGRQVASGGVLDECGEIENFAKLYSFFTGLESRSKEQRRGPEGWLGYGAGCNWPGYGNAQQGQQSLSRHRSHTETSRPRSDSSRKPHRRKSPYGQPNTRMNLRHDLQWKTAGVVPGFPRLTAAMTSRTAQDKDKFFSRPRAAPLHEQKVWFSK